MVLLLLNVGHCTLNQVLKAIEFHTYSHFVDSSLYAILLRDNVQGDPSG